MISASRQLIRPPRAASQSAVRAAPAWADSKRGTRTNAGARAMTHALPAPHPDALAAMSFNPEEFAAVCIANPQAVKPVPASAVC